MRDCSIEGCNTEAKAGHGWCFKHYMRWRRHGDPLARLRQDLLAVLNELAYTETDDCLPWPGHRSHGYGMITIDGRQLHAHREILRIRAGDPPGPRMEAAHGPCHNRACVNYRHLYWATRQQNADDMRRDGTWLRGTNNSQAKLTPEEVVEIRERHAAGITQKRLGEEYGVHENTIRSVVRRENWDWVP